VDIEHASMMTEVDADIFNEGLLLNIVTKIRTLDNQLHIGTTSIGLCWLNVQECFKS